MILRKKLFRFFLWWAVVGFSIWLGGTIFSMSVVVPMWSESGPQSVKEFFGGTSFNKYIFNFFGPPWMAIRNLPVLIVLILGWNYKPHRNYLLVTFVILIVSIVFTLTVIYPINEILMVNAGGGNSSEVVQAMVDRWIFLDRLRFGLMFVGYFFLLKSFSTPVQDTLFDKKL